MTNSADRVTLAAIAEHIDANGYPPSRLELARLLGRSARSTGQYAINRLESQGLIQVDRRSARSLRITDAGMKALTEEM